MHQGLEAAVFPAGLIALRRPLLAKCLSTLARLDVRVAPWAARWRDHFLLMTGLGVWDFRVNALISDRRGRNHALCSAVGAVPRPSSVPGGSLPCGILFSTVSCVSPLEAAKPISGTKQKPKKISAAPIVQLTAHARPILVRATCNTGFVGDSSSGGSSVGRAPQVQGKRTPTMPVGAYLQPPHGPHADRLDGGISVSNNMAR